MHINYFTSHGLLFMDQYIKIVFELRTNGDL